MTIKPARQKIKFFAEDKRQLLFYQIAAEDALHLKVKNLKYYFLEDPGSPTREFLGSQADKEKLKERFVANIKDILAEKFNARPVKQICDKCEFRDICEEKKI